MKKLTLTQKSIIMDLVSTAQSSLEYDESMDEYTDGGRMILSLSKADYEELMKINLAIL